MIDSIDCVNHRGVKHRIPTCGVLTICKGANANSVVGSQAVYGYRDAITTIMTIVGMRHCCQSPCCSGKKSYIPATEKLELEGGLSYDTVEKDHRDS